jgi:hypothetical protein
MARGFESKDVEFQQAEAERRRSSTTRVVGRDAVQRRTIELALVRVRSELASAVRAAHREMLERAVKDLEQLLSNPQAGDRQ